MAPMPPALRRLLTWPIVLAVLFLPAGRAADDAALTPLRVSPNGHGLVDAHGQPIFVLADTAWSLALRLSRDDAAGYLRARKAQEFNAVTFVLFAPGKTELTGRLSNPYGAIPFAETAGRPDPTRPLVTPGRAPDDPAQYDYWDHVDYLVALARQTGLYVILLPTWGSGVVGSYDGKDTRDVVFTADNARVYGEWLGRRYAAAPNVLWMLGGDRAAINGDHDSRPIFRALAAGLKAGAPAQLISYHPRKSAPQSAEWFQQDDWLAFNSIQEWPEAQVRQITADWNRVPAKPTWIFEGRYEGYWRNNYKAGDWGEWQVRQQAYQTVFAGAFGHTYGHERVFGFGQDKADWKAHLHAPGARSMTHLKRLMGHFTADELRDRIPDQGLVAGDPGEPERLKSDFIAATRDAAGRKAMIYTANGRPIRVQLGRLAPGQVTAYWFNPRDGQWAAAGKTSALPLAFARDMASGAGAAEREFVPPSHGEGSDWVLVLESQGGDRR
jgi:hypothetical protein